MIDNLYKQRSYARCVGEGFGFLADNLKMVTKVMGPYFLIASVLLVMYNAVNTHINVSDLAGKEVATEEVVADITLLLMVVVAYCLAYRRMYIMFKRLCSTSEKSHNINKVYKIFFGHLGKITGTSLLALFGVIVMSAVMYLPFVIATNTYLGSVEAEVNFGDTIQIPTYGYVMMFVVCTLCYTVINLFSVAFFATLLFLYGDMKGDIKEQENEKTAFNR